MEHLQVTPYDQGCVDDVVEHHAISAPFIFKVTPIRTCALNTDNEKRGHSIPLCLSLLSYTASVCPSVFLTPSLAKCTLKPPLSLSIHNFLSFNHCNTLPLPPLIWHGSFASFFLSVSLSPSVSHLFSQHTYLGLQMGGDEKRGT